MSHYSVISIVSPAWQGLAGGGEMSRQGSAVRGLDGRTDSADQGSYLSPLTSQGKVRSGQVRRVIMEQRERRYFY